MSAPVLPRRAVLAAAASLALAGCTATVPQAVAGTRVVALGYVTDADAALAVGVAPVAMPRPSGTPQPEPWTLAALGPNRPEYLTVGADLPIERIAALRPDLILATGLYAVDRYREPLSRIAELVAPVTGPNTDRWQDTTLRVGRALGREQVAAQQVRTTEDVVRRARERYPRLAGRTFTFSSYSASGAWWTKSSAADAIALLLGGFGMRIAEPVTGLPPSPVQGMSPVSPERLDVLDADVAIVFFGSDEQRRRCEATPSFARIDAVRDRRYVPVDPVDGHAMTFPSALSVRHVAGVVVPRIAAALR